MCWKKLLFLLIIIVGLGSSSFTQEENIQQRFSRTNPNISTLTGTIKSEHNSPLTDVLLTVIDNESHDFIGNYSPEISTGIYSIPLNKSHNYQIIVECQGYFAYLVEIRIESNSKKEIEKNIIIPDSYRKSFILNFAELIFDEKNINTLSDIGRLMSENPDMKIRLVYEEDSISRLLADSVFLRFNSLGYFSDRVLSSRLAPKDPAEYIVDLEIKHKIIPELIPLVIPDEKILEEKHITELRINKDSVNRIVDEEGEPVFTIQLAASKKPFKPGHFQGLSGIKVYHGKDGFYRYTCGRFVSRRAAEQKLKQLKEKGYSQSYIREIKDYLD